MSQSFCILTVAFLAAQTPQQVEPGRNPFAGRQAAPRAYQSSPAPYAVSRPMNYGSGQTSNRFRLFPWLRFRPLRGLFRPFQSRTPPAYQPARAPKVQWSSDPAPAVNRFQPPITYPHSADVTPEPPLIRPNPGQPKQQNPAPLQEAVFKTSPGKINLALSNRFANKIGNDKNYAWITGQLFQHRGKWVIRYAADDVIDRHGGRVVLATGADMSRFHHGDLVCVHGSVANDPASRQVNGIVVYQANEVHLLERGGPR